MKIPKSIVNKMHKLAKMNSITNSLSNEIDILKGGKMIVAKTKCYYCNKVVELDDFYGWTKEDENRKITVCEECIEKLKNEEDEDY